MSRDDSESKLDFLRDLTPRQLEIELAKARAELTQAQMEARAAALQLKVLKIEAELEKSGAKQTDRQDGDTRDKSTDRTVQSSNLTALDEKPAAGVSGHVGRFVVPRSDWETSKEACHEDLNSAEAIEKPASTKIPAATPLGEDDKGGLIQDALHVAVLDGRVDIRSAVGEDPQRQSDLKNLTGQEDSLESSERARQRVRRLFSKSPSWLVSVIAHVIVILAMALWMLPLPLRPQEIFISGGTEASDEAPFEDEVEFEAEPSDLEEFDAESESIEDLGAVGLGEIDSVTAPTQLSAVGLAANNSNITDIGALLGSDGEGITEVGSETGGAEFFGVKAGGNQFVFVVDCSRSMRGESWDAARNELVDSVRALDPKKSFYVIFYGAELFPMFDEANPEPRAVRATPENVARFEKWLRTMDLVRGASPNKALRLAVELRPDAIYLLTDGKFPDSTEKYLQKVNQSSYDVVLGEIRPTVIHTIGFGREGEGILQRIANDNGGSYRFVVPPEVPKPKKRGR